MKIYNLSYINFFFGLFILFVLSVSPIFAGTGNSFMEIGTKQGWFIPNDYETSQNPPACILRSPTRDEYKTLFDFCKSVDDSSVNCDNQIKDFLINWEKNNCQKLGMKVRTLPDGSFRSYFPKLTATVAPRPTLSPTTTVTSIPNQSQTALPIIVTLANLPANATDYAAWAGFILSLSLGIFELWKYWNDKPKLKITARYDQEIMAIDSYGRMTNEASGKTFWTLDVANTGNKNIIITSIAFSQKDTKKMSMLTKDYTGQINRYTLIPGDNHSYTIPDELLDPKKIIEVQLHDATGKIYKKRIKFTW